MKSIYILILVLTFIACNKVDNNKHDSKKVLDDNHILEGVFIENFNDSANLYDCKVYDTLTNTLRNQGTYIVYDDKYTQPYGWITYWDEKGHEIEKIEYKAVKGSREIVTNQWIRFGTDSLDTLINRSHFMLHELTLLDDSVHLKLDYYGQIDSTTNFAFIPLTGIHDEFVFKSDKPTVSFNLPIDRFIQDSSIRILLIKSTDIKDEKDMINMGHMYYNIPLNQK